MSAFFGKFEMYGLGRILGFFIFLGSILLGGYFADNLNLGSDVGYSLGCLVGALIWFGIMQAFRSSRGMGRASKEDIAQATSEVKRSQRKPEEAREQVRNRREDKTTKDLIDEKNYLADRMSSTDQIIATKVTQYYQSTQEILRNLTTEAELYDPTMAKLSSDESPEAQDTIKAILRNRHDLAYERLSKLKSLTPPEEINEIHNTYLKAFIHGVDARREEFFSNHFKAADLYAFSSKELTKAVELWKSMGIS